MDIRLRAPPACVVATGMQQALAQAIDMLGLAACVPNIEHDASLTSPELIIAGENVQPCLPDQGLIDCPTCARAHAVADREIMRWHLARAARRKTVLFICSGNAVRSQMAEALTNHFLRGQWAAFSGGIHPMPLWQPVISALREIGVDANMHKAKHIELFLGCRFDVVISLCASTDAFCTAFPGGGWRRHIPFEDPFTHAFFGIGDLERTRKLRDAMCARILPFLSGEP